MIPVLFRLFSLLPLPVLHALGATLGLVMFAFSSKQRSRMRENLALAFPNNPNQRRVMLASAMHGGMAIFELPYLWGRVASRGIQRCMFVESWKTYDTYFAQGRGVLLITPHIGSFEAVAQMFATKQEVTVLYKPNKNDQVQRIIETGRARNNVVIAPTNLTGVRQMLRALKNNRTVGLLPDQVPAHGEGGVMVPFFGKEAFTMTLPGALYSKTKASILLCMGVRIPLRGFKLEMSYLNVPEGLDQKQFAIFLNKELEKMILRYPGQYYWGYKRYKLPAEVQVDG